MADRVLLGNHGTYGYGIFTSNPGTDVLAANRTDFTIDSQAAGSGQLLFTKLIGTSGTGTVTQDFSNHGFHCYAHIYWVPYEPSSTTGMAVTGTLGYASSVSTIQATSALTFKIEYINSTTGRITYTRASGAAYGFFACVYAEEGATG